jgi:hypothetical protein
VRVPAVFVNLHFPVVGEVGDRSDVAQGARAHQWLDASEEDRVPGDLEDVGRGNEQMPLGQEQGQPCGVQGLGQRERRVPFADVDAVARQDLRIRVLDEERSFTPEGTS